MKHDIIKTDDYLLVVDESEIKEGDWVFNAYQKQTYRFNAGSGVGLCKKIIAHLPLNGSPILKGVDLLPPLEVDNSLGTPLVQYIFEKHNQDRVMGFCDGYNKAKEKYKYTEEDMYMLAAFVTDFIAGRKGDFMTTTPKNVADKFIQSLSQPKMPIGFEFEASKSRPVFNGEPKNISNFVGFTRWTWEGKYIYE